MENVFSGASNEALTALVVHMDSICKLRQSKYRSVVGGSLADVGNILEAMKVYLERAEMPDLMVNVLREARKYLAQVCSTRNL